MPGKDTVLSFKDHKKSQRIMFMVYAIFEAFVQNISTLSRVQTVVIRKNTENTHRWDFVITLNLLTVMKS